MKLDITMPEIQKMLDKEALIALNEKDICSVLKLGEGLILTEESGGKDSALIATRAILGREDIPKEPKGVIAYYNTDGEISIDCLKEAAEMLCDAFASCRIQLGVKVEKGYINHTEITLAIAY